MRIALGLEYDGTAYSGWQRLAHGPSLQAEVERALSFVADHPVEVTCAGRTDAGVHARGQVLHFDTEAERSTRGWVLGTNSRLPPDIAVLWAQRVPDGFHARFSARARRYRYTLLNRAVRPALDARFVTWERQPLDAVAMHDAAQGLLGENDFSAFRSVQCQARTPMRNLQAATVSRDGDRVRVELQANAFLHHMVRNIVGSLLPVGRGERPVDWPGELLAGRDRSRAGPTAPASGLAMRAALYPAEWNLPPEVTL